MARSSAAPPPVNSVNFLGWLREILNRTQKLEEEYEPPNVIGTGSRIVMTSPNGTRYAVTVSNAGAWVLTAL